jgi:serine/threonine protein phosphatase PrpC
MQCPNCGAENRVIARFCQHCGAALAPAVAAEVSGAGRPEGPGEAVLEAAIASQVVAQEQAVTEVKVATGEQVAAQEAAARQEAAAAQEEAVVPEQATIEQVATIDQVATIGQVATGEQVVTAEQGVAQEQIGAAEQAAAEGPAAEQLVAQDEAESLQGAPVTEQSAAEGQPVALEHVGGGGERIVAEGAAIDVPAQGPPSAETAEPPALEEPTPGATPGLGAVPDEGPLEGAAYRAEDEVQTDMPENTVPEAGLEEEAKEGAIPGAHASEEAAGDAAVQPGEAASAEASSTEAELREADVLPWRDEPSSLAPLEPGTVLDGCYRIVELLATDEAGVLYSARDLRRCPQCGFAGNSPDQAFCASCGAVLDQKPLVRVLQHPAGQDPPPGIEVLDHITEGERVYWVWKEPGKQTDVLGGSEEPMRLDIGQRTHPGQTRELDEDSLLTLALTRTFESLESASALFVVADGMGGHEAGEVASRIAIRALADVALRDVFARELAGAELDDETVQGALRRAVQVANEQVFLERERRENDMGTTVTAALLRDWTLFIAHVGDCRAYRWGKDGLQQLTTDHSVIASMVASGAAQPEEVYTHPHRSVIYRSVGDQPSVEVDTAVLSVEPGDRLVLCCDGLWEMLRDEGIEEVLLREADPQRACDAMVEQANEAGGPDNISVIVVQL